MVGILQRSRFFADTLERSAGVGLNPLNIVIDDVTGPVSAIIAGKPTLMFGTNSYLGLNFDPRCIAAAEVALSRYGTGSTASRVASGNQGLHLALEREIAALYCARDAIVFSTGFMANLGVIGGLTKEGDLILLDAHCHASIFDACKLAGATVKTFRHNDAADLERILKEQTIPGDRTLVVVEGLYSVWGDVGALEPIMRVAKAHGAVTFVDEAHSLGVFGATGRGVCEAQGVEALVDVIVGTFSKSVGVIGGYCVSNAPELRSLRFQARPYLYTASPPPAVVASATEAIRLIRTEPALRETLWRNAKALHEGLSGLGLKLTAAPGPVGAIAMPGIRAGLETWRGLIARGLYVNMLIPPSTPAGEVLLRYSVSAAHSLDDIRTAVALFAETIAAVKAA
jgi:8-amino-7-oxononanoate synthase